MARPPIPQDRLSWRSDGKLVMSLKRTWKGGVRAVVFEPLALIARLAALVPAPYMHLRRFYGIFAPNHGLRAHIVPTPPDPQSATAPVAPKRPKSMPWADLLMRVWRIDALRCPYCGGRMRVICAIGDPDAITADTEPRPQSMPTSGPTAPSTRLTGRCSTTPTLSERPVSRPRSDRQPAERRGASTASPTDRTRTTDAATTPRLPRPDPRKVRRRESSQPSVCDCVPFVPGASALFFLYSRLASPHPVLRILMTKLSTVMVQP